MKGGGGGGEWKRAQFLIFLTLNSFFSALRELSPLFKFFFKKNYIFRPAEGRTATYCQRNTKNGRTIVPLKIISIAKQVHFFYNSGQIFKV